MSEDFDPFKVDPFQETLRQLAKRVSKDAGVPMEVITSGVKGIEKGGARKDPLATKIIEVRERFCYEAYSTGRYSLAQIGRFCRLGHSARMHVRERIKGYARRKGLLMPKITDKRRQNKAARSVEFVPIEEY